MNKLENNCKNSCNGETRLSHFANITASYARNFVPCNSVNELPLRRWIHKQNEAENLSVTSFDTFLRRFALFSLGSKPLSSSVSKINKSASIPSEAILP